MQPIAQPPRKDDRSFDDWMFRLWKRIASTAGLAWELIDKNGSNLTDLTTRNHADLQNINTASYTHLTATNHTDLTDGGVTTLHKHDNGYVTYPESLKIGSPTHLATLQDSINHMWSAGLVDGGVLTDNGDGTVTIAVGTAVTHASTNPHTDLYQAIVPQRTLTLTDGVANYIYVDYNSGTPQYAVGTSTSDFNCIDKCIIYLAHRSGTSVHTIDAREQNVDGNRKTRRLFLDFAKFIHAENGTVLGANGLAVTLTAGKFYFMLQEIDHVAFDTSVAGTANANVFTLWNHVAGVYTSTANSKVISTTLYDNGTGTTTLGNNKYGVTWFYLMNDAPSELHAVMGQVEYANAEEAEAASPPATLPGILTSLGSLVGYVIYEKSAVAFYDVRSAFSQRFTSSAATLHNGLAGIQGGSVNQYYHLTSAEYTGTGTGNFVRETSPTITTATLASASISGVNGNLYSNTYTPTLTNGTNVSSSTSYAQGFFTRINNQVQFNIVISITPTAVGAFDLQISLPVASSFTLTRHASGCAVANSATAIQLANVYADSTNDTLLVNGFFNDTAARVWNVSGRYIVL